MKNNEVSNSAPLNNNGQTGWEGVAALANSGQRRLPEYEVNSNGDTIFSKFGKEIIFGTTENTRRVDVFPQENQEDYESSVVGIETYDGNCYFISEGVFVDRRNGKKIDLLKKRSKDAEFSFPSIRIGYKLPYRQISESLKVPEGEGGTVVKVVSYGEASAGHSEGSKMKHQIQGAIHGMIMENEEAKQIRHIH